MLQKTLWRVYFKWYKTFKEDRINLSKIEIMLSVFFDSQDNRVRYECFEGFAKEYSSKETKIMSEQLMVSASR